MMTAAAPLATVLGYATLVAGGHADRHLPSEVRDSLARTLREAARLAGEEAGALGDRRRQLRALAHQADVLDDRETPVSQYAAICIRSMFTHAEWKEARR